MKKFTKMLVLQATVSLFIAPTMLASPEIVQAVTTESAQENQNQVGNVSLQKVEQVESGNLVWTVLIEKSSSEMNRQMTFTVTEPTDVLSVYQPDKEQQVQPDKNGIYQIGENNQQAQTMQLEIQTKKIPQQFDYTLKISPVINEGEQQLLLNQKETYDFSFTATEETSSEETNTTEESTTATESSTSEVEETASETTEMTSSAESATSSSTTKTSESTKNTSGSTTQRAVAPAVAARSGLVRASLGTGNPIVPKGAIKLDGIFSTIAKSRPNGTNISAGEVILPGSSDQNNGMPYDEISLSGSNRAVGVWSNDKYRLDFNQDFHGRTYVNFGTEQADGFAFVMQNDPAKSQALTTANSKSDGQNLGVYGGTNSWGKEDSKRPNVFAIKNSVAVEFDLYGNTDANESDGTNYDGQSADTKIIPHMAYAYPGDLANGYISMGGSSWWNTGFLGIGAHGYTAMINHRGLTTLDGVRNTTWYEFRYDFDKASQKFSYYLENPVTGVKTNATTIPYADLEAQLKLSANEGKAYWGFTAANGASSGQTKFVFTQVPVDMDAEVTNDVESEGASVVDQNDSESYSKDLPAANYGNEVTLKSTFTLKADTEAGYFIKTWSSFIDPTLYDISQGVSNVKAEFNGVTTTGAATVDENGNVVVTFADKGLNVPKPLTSIEQKLNLSYTTKLKNKGEPTKTYHDSQISGTEIGNNTATNFSSDEVAYWVVPQPEHPTVLSWETPNVVTEKTETKDRSEVADGYDLTFYWKDEDDGDILNFTINRNDPDATNEFAQIVTTGSTEFNSHSWHIPADKIVPGVNDYTITMKRGDEVQTLKLKLDVTGKLSFETAPDMLSWTGRKASESKGTLARDSGNPMTLSVFDSREDTSTWSLYVQAELTDATAPFDFVFKKDASSAEQTIMSDPVLVMRKGDVTPTDFMTTKTWNESEGVLLQSGNYMRVGDYSGKAVVKWNLYDTEVPE
ncbi:hypothetical protein ACFC3A_03810 [Enterococcus thailandicus]|uniref:hypothetical protein n=1 Tax=Enterococcus thailandicus TaxID=417368 RepID=UPI0022E554CE|nr:hypothetical protein [Enterococcus thailandicus]